jgi:hypothetical protein
MDDTRRPPEMSPDPLAAPDVAVRILVLNEGIRTNPTAYLNAIRHVAATAGMGQLLPQPDDTVQVAPDEHALSVTEHYLEDRDDRETTYDADTDAALAEDPAYLLLVQSVKADHAAQVRGRTYSDRKSETAGPKREQLSVYRLWFFISRAVALATPSTGVAGSDTCQAS